MLLSTGTGMYTSTFFMAFIVVSVCCKDKLKIKKSKITIVVSEQLIRNDTLKYLAQVQYICVKI